LKDIGCFPSLFQVFTYFRLAASRRYADHGMFGRSAMIGSLDRSSGARSSEPPLSSQAEGTRRHLNTRGMLDALTSYQPNDSRLKTRSCHQLM
jgi:hypothetical protein